jgi:hypothetical protein
MFNFGVVLELVLDLFITYCSFPLSAAMLHKVGFSLLLMVLLSATLAFSAIATLFQAQADYDGSVGRVVNESGVYDYALSLKANDEPTFTKFSSVSSSGQGRYQHLGSDVYYSWADGTGTLSGPFISRLVAQPTIRNQSRTNTRNETPNAVQRSWGSIKLMFR